MLRNAFLTDWTQGRVGNTNITSNIHNMTLHVLMQQSHVNIRLYLDVLHSH